MKIYSGIKVDYAKTNFIRHNIDVFAEAIMKEPMKGGHTHNHVDNQMEKLIVRKSERKRLRKLFKKKQSTNKVTKKG